MPADVDETLSHVKPVAVLDDFDLADNVRCRICALSDFQHPPPHPV